MKCTACNKELNRKEVVFTDDKKPYCQNPFQCNDNHPNSVANILARGGAVNLYTEEELEMNFFDMNSISPEMKDRILKVATKPQSIRLSKYEIAHYLIALQEENKLASISEAVRYCVQIAMSVEPIGRQQHVPTPEPVAVEKSKGIKIIPKEYAQEIPIPAIPKSVNVDWSKVEAVPTSAPKEEEEEMTF
jgi:hypothetical protein